jgi:ribosome-associated protein
VISVAKISTEFIRLEQFLKFTGMVSTGGEAKQIIRDGMVRVNGETETRRGRKLYPGDEVSLEGNTLKVE